MIAYGIWSKEAGGFIVDQLSQEEIPAEIADLIEQGEDPEDLEGLAICEYHEDQPADSCEEC